MAIPDDIKTVEQTLAWVGDDLERAAEALDGEQAAEKPRSSLVEKLEALLTDPQDGDTGDAVVEHTDGDPVWVLASSGRAFEVPYGDDTYLRLIREGGVIVPEPPAEDG